MVPRLAALTAVLLLAGCAHPGVGAPEVASVQPAPASPPSPVPAPTPEGMFAESWRFAVPGVHHVAATVDGEATEARFIVPEGAPVSIMIFAKGLMTTLPELDDMMLPLAANSTLSLAMDFRGEHGTWKVATGARDTAAAATTLRQMFPDTPIAIFGFSMGGEVAAIALADTEPGTVDHLVVAGAATDLMDLWDVQTFWRDIIEAETGGRPWEATDAYLERSPLHRIDDIAAADATRIHILHGVADTLVPVTHAESFYAALHRVDQPVSYHQVTRNRDSWVCSAVVFVCAATLPVGPANHEASVFGPVETLLAEVAAGEWDNATGSHRYLVDGVNGERVRLT